jgi:thioesterase domain-containing protein
VTTQPFTVPATPMQEALWWVHQRARNKSVYNITWRLGCAAPLAADALRTAWQLGVDRNVAVRTGGARHDDVVTLTVVPHAIARVQLVTLDDPGPAPVGVLLRLVAEELQERTTALDEAPLARLTMVRVGAEHELVLTVHHVVADGWAIQLLVADLSVAYAAALRGEAPQWPAEPVPFSVFAREVAQAREDGRWQDSVEHWRKVLEGAAATTVVADRQRYASTGAAGAMLRYAFSAEAADGIAALAKSTFATPFAVVLAGVQIVLARAAAPDADADISVGVVAANRNGLRDQQLVGFLANLCVARAAVSPGDTVGDVVGRARDAGWEMLAHQAVPYPVVFAALSDDTQTMLREAVPLLLNYLGPIGSGLSMGDVAMTIHPTPNRAARADIGLGLLDDDGTLLMEIEYNTGRYDVGTVLRLLHDLDAVFAAGGVDPGRPVGSLPVETRATSGYLDHRQVAPTPGELPTSAAMAQVARAWTQVLGAPPRGPDEDFFAAGGRSLKVLELAAAVEAEAGTPLDVVTWLAEPSPRRAVAQLESGTTETAPTTSTLLTLRPGTGPHLHLVHGAGGAVQDYRDLLAALPADWRVTLSQEREPHDSVPAMAARYRTDLDATGARPDVLGGWSMGGQIAFAMATGYGAGAPALLLMDSTPPVGYEIPADIDRLRLDAFVAGVLRAVDLTGPAPGTGDDEPDADLALRALAAYLAAAGQPVPTTVLLERWATYHRHAVAVASFVTTEQVDAPALVVGAGLLDVQLEEWAQRLRRPPDILRVAADHHGVLRAPVTGQVAEAVLRLMAATVAR